MKIAVCVKEVPDATAARRIDPATRRLDRSGERTLNPFDAHAVEEALRLKEGPAGADSEIVVICMGPETALRTLGKALSLGADRALLISDPSLAGADIWLTAKVLAAALEREAPDLVLLGQQAADSESYVMAAAVADRLRRPLVTQVAQLTLDGATIRAKRQTESGYDVIEAPLPAVVSVADSINDPRYPSLKAIMGAKKKPQETLSAADLGISERSRTEVLELSSPPAKAGGVRLEDEGGSPPSRSWSSSSSGRSSSMGDILVFSEQHDGEFTRPLVLLREAARLLADALGVQAHAVVRGVARRGRPRRARRARGERASCSADDPALASGLPQPAVDAVAGVVADGGRDTARPVRGIGARIRHRRGARRRARRRPRGRCRRAA